MPPVLFAGVAEAARRLAAGGVIVYPTETYYGLGAVLESAAVERIIEMKRRKPGKALPVLLASREMLETVSDKLPPPAAILADHFWPGPLTLVVPAREHVPVAVTAGTGTIGVRVTSHPVAAGLSRTLGTAIVATSANPAAMPPPVHLGTAINYFGSAVDGYLDGGVLRGRGSTVVSIEEGRIRLLRAGAVPVEAIRKVLPEIAG